MKPFRGGEVSKTKIADIAKESAIKEKKPTQPKTLL